MKITNAYPQQKSPVEEAYKRWMGEYPPTTPSVDNYEDTRWRAFQMGYNASKEENKWKTVALRFGETLSSIGPCGYYGMTADEWLEWANDTYEKNADELLPLVKRGIRKNEVKEHQPTPQEPEELKTLYQMLYDEECRDDICYVVKEWMSQYADNVMCGEYKKGYEYCLLVLEENLK
jgi:hypothetical protein